MLAISRSDIRQAVTILDAIDAARAAFVALSGGDAWVPQRPHVSTTNGISAFMPGYDPGTGALGIKMLTLTSANRTRGLPYIQAVVLLAEEVTGTPAAIVEGTFLTQMRTGAAMGLAADLLARPDARTVALFGAGATAGTSLWAVCSVRDIREVRVVHPHAERFPEFERNVREYLGESCPPLRRVTSPTEAVDGADIVLTATSSSTPLFPGEGLGAGAFVGALGAWNATTRELDADTIVRSRVVVDTRASALHEAGDILIPIAEGRISAEHIWAELGEIATGSRPGRTSADEIIVFKSVGNAMQDLILAQRVYERARAMNLGTEIDL